LIVMGEQISPDPDKNRRSTAEAAGEEPAQVPGNAESLWRRIIGIFD
jgi:hypothetical protein